MSQQSLPTLLLYDFLEVCGGAERVLLNLLAHWHADVCVGFVRPQSFGAHIPPSQLHDLHADHAFGPLRIARVLQAFARQGERLARQYPRRVYSGAYAVLAHDAGHGGRSVYYCHTPPRFLYDLREHYSRQLPAWQRPALAVLRAWLQPRYEQALGHMDVVLANSRNVQNRLRQYLRLEAPVVYPPVEVDQFPWRADGDFFLSTSRLEPLKRVDTLVKAFRAIPGETLVVASGGSELDKLKRLADGAPNIHFTGWLDDDALKRLIGEARATLYVPRDEDFGMSPVESMAAGKPVIGVAEGGMLETVLPGETGVLLHDLSVPSLREAVSRLTPERCQAMRTACEQQARRFSKTHFLRELAQALDGAAPLK